MTICTYCEEEIKMKERYVIVPEEDRAPIFAHRDCFVDYVVKEDEPCEQQESSSLEGMSWG